MIPYWPWTWPYWNCTTPYKFSLSIKKMGEGWTGRASDIVKAESSAEDPRATGGLVSNLPHPRVNKAKQHTEQSHFVFPQMLAASSVAGQPNRQYWKRRGQSRGINPAQATQLWDTEAPVGELGCDASSPSSACIAFLHWWASLKTVLIMAEEISSTLVPRGFAVLYPISRSGTRPQSLPHRVHCWHHLDWFLEIQFS